MSSFSHHITELPNLSGQRLAEEATLSAVAIAWENSIDRMLPCTHFSTALARSQTVAPAGRFATAFAA